MVYVILMAINSYLLKFYATNDIRSNFFVATKAHEITRNEYKISLGI